MKTHTRRSLFVTMAGVSAVPVLVAQQRGRRGRGGGMMNPDAMMKMYTERLKLSSEQQEKVRKLIEDDREKMRGIREKSGGDRAAMREQMMKVRKEFNEKMSGILSKEQRSEYRAMMKERRSRMGGGRGNKK